MESGQASRRSADWHWSNYWRDGLLTTFAMGHFQSGYGGQVADFWDRQFRDQPAGAVIVDLATGNGAILQLAARHFAGRGEDARIIGVDYADVRLPADPELRREMDGVELLGRTPMEETGLESGLADLVTSHFGLEYGDRDQAVAEAARLLHPGGRLALVLHHPGSAVVQQAATDSRQTRLILNEERFDRKVADLVEIVGDARSPQAREKLRFNPDAERGRRQINRSLERLYQQVRDQDPTHLLKVTQTFMRVFDDLKDRSRQEKLQFIRDFRESMQAYAARMESMARATLDDAAYRDLTDSLDRHGFTDAASGELHHDEGELIGRTLIARRE